MMLDRQRIEQLVPHAGQMCLIHGVYRWDDQSIECVAKAPRADHPLARDGALSSLMAIEFAAQATAVHGALVDGLTQPRDGMLVKLRDVALFAPAFDADTGDLTIEAELLSRGASGCLYTFNVACSVRPLVRGRLMVAYSSMEAE